MVLVSEVIVGIDWVPQALRARTPSVAMTHALDCFILASLRLS
jgi:hypothetical protein